MTRYGYVGLGMMGSAMAQNLIGTGAEVTVFDLAAAPMAVAVDQGATAATNPAEVAERSDVVSICVPAAEHIDAVLTGAHGMAEGAHPGLSILIHSTVHPDTMRTARDTAAGWGVPLFDACVAGGADNARAGTQTVLAGGVRDMPDRVRALLDIYATKIIAAGPVGAGAALKIAINVMTYAQFAAAATAHDLVEAQGGDPTSLLEAWREMGQLGTLTEQYSALLDIPAAHIVGDFRHMLEAQVGISQKDLALATQLGQARAGAAEMLEALRDMMPAVYNIDEEQAP